MIKKLVIVGAGSHGYGIQTIVHAINENRYEWDLLGYLDDDSSKAGVIGPVNSDIKSCYYIIGVNNPNLKKALHKNISLKKAATLIHPSALIGPNMTFGYGIAVFAGAIFTGKSTVGNHSHVNVGSTISQGSNIGEYCSIGPGCNIAGQVIIGSGTLVGTGASIVNLIKIGQDSKIGAGAVVINSFPEENKTIVGVPARCL